MYYVEIKMAKLIKCSLCKKEMSSTVKNCPNCGHKNHAKISIFSVIFLIIVIIVIWSYFTGNNNLSKTNTTGYVQSSKLVSSENNNTILENEINEDIIKPYLNLNYVESAMMVTQPPKVNATDLIYAYENNPVKADLTYKGNIIDINGLVLSVNNENSDDNNLSEILITLTSAQITATDGSPYPIRCYFDTKYSNFAASLNRGDTAEFVCGAVGQVNDEITLNNCTPSIQFNKERQHNIDTLKLFERLDKNKIGLQQLKKSKSTVGIIEYQYLITKCLNFDPSSDMTKCNNILDKIIHPASQNINESSIGGVDTHALRATNNINKKSLSQCLNRTGNGDTITKLNATNDINLKLEIWGKLAACQAASDVTSKTAKLSKAKFLKLLASNSINILTDAQQIIYDVYNLNYDSYMSKDPNYFNEHKNDPEYTK